MKRCKSTISWSIWVGLSFWNFFQCFQFWYFRKLYQPIPPSKFRSTMLTLSFWSYNSKGIFFYFFRLIFINITKYQNIYGLCNKIKKPMKLVESFHKCQICPWYHGRLSLLLLHLCDLFIFSSRLLEVLFFRIFFLLFLNILFFCLNVKNIWDRLKIILNVI